MQDYSYETLLDFIENPKRNNLKVADMLGEGITSYQRKLHINPPFDKSLDQICISIDRSKPIVIFDFNDLGRKMNQFLAKRGFIVDCFCTFDTNFENNIVDSLKIYSIHQISKLAGNINIIICTHSNTSDICEQLIELGFGSDIIGVVNFIKYNNYTPIMNNLDKIKELYEILTEERSRMVLHGILKGKLSSNLDYLNESLSISNEPQYFTAGIVPFSDDECYVDGGAYDGTQIRQFINYSQNKYRSILSFEPDPQNYLKARATVDELDDNRIKLMPYGLYSEQATFDFIASNNESSRLSSTKNDNSFSIYTVKLDDYIDEKPSFIKLDIEGAELKALQGGERLIRTHRPKMSICLYHKPEDIWEIPLYIHSLGLNYKMYIRQHFKRFIDTVLYAIPS